MAHSLRKMVWYGAKEAHYYSRDEVVREGLGGRLGMREAKGLLKGNSGGSGRRAGVI